MCLGLDSILQGSLQKIPDLFLYYDFCASFQVAKKCNDSLHELSPILRQKRTASIMESMHHMIAVLTSYISKVKRLS